VAVVRVDVLLIVAGATEVQVRQEDQDQTEVHGLQEIAQVFLFPMVLFFFPEIRLNQAVVVVVVAMVPAGEDPGEEDPHVLIVLGITVEPVETEVLAVAEVLAVQAVADHSPFGNSTPTREQTSHKRPHLLALQEQGEMEQMDNPLPTAA
jgi:hypothetical protein